MIVFSYVLFNHTLLYGIISWLCQSTKSFEVYHFLRAVSGTAQLMDLLSLGCFCSQIIASLVSVHIQGNSVSPSLWWMIKLLHNSSHQPPSSPSSSSTFFLLPLRPGYLACTRRMIECRVCIWWGIRLLWSERLVICIVWQVLLPFQLVSTGSDSVRLSKNRGL